MASVATTERGQIIQRRSRRWLVDEVKPSGLPIPAMELPFARRQHLLSLASVEEDGMGRSCGSSGRSSREGGSS